MQHLYTLCERKLKSTSPVLVNLPRTFAAVKDALISVDENCKLLVVAIIKPSKYESG